MPCTTISVISALRARRYARRCSWGGVTRRFPTLNFAFLEGGVGWACALYSDLIGHWKKRNPAALEEINPANIDRELIMRLFRRYGGSDLADKVELLRNPRKSLSPRTADPEASL